MPPISVQPVRGGPSIGGLSLGIVAPGSLGTLIEVVYGALVVTSQAPVSHRGVGETGSPGLSSGSEHLPSPSPA